MAFGDAAADRNGNGEDYGMERKQQRWEKGQSMLHRDDKGRFRIENAYGRLEYVKEDSRQKDAKNGFVLEAREAPGTAGHTEKEKHLDLKAVKDADFKEERFLYTSEKPFREQAVFYDVREWERSREFMACMKSLLDECGHQTLKSTFGFLEQKPERVLKQMLERERLQSLSLEEFDLVNKQLDTLNTCIQKKEAEERKLCAWLQLMIDRGKEEAKETAGRFEFAGNFFVAEERKEKEEDSKDGETEDVQDEELGVVEKTVWPGLDFT